MKTEKILTDYIKVICQGLTLKDPGTVDWIGPGFLNGHYGHDVAPAYLANELDGGVGAGGGLTVVITQLTGGPIINSSPGRAYRKYLEVRPLWAEEE